MKVLVTGAAGLIGSHLCDSLIEQGYSVFGIDDLSFGDRDNIPSNVEFFNDKVENISKYGEFDIIYHLGSLKKVWDGSISSCDVLGAPTNLRYSYALSKWHSEQYILNAHTENELDCSIVRVFGCASPRSNKSWSGGHVPLFIKLALDNKDITIHGDGLQTRSISHAKDIADGLVKMHNITGEIINLVTDEQTTVRSVAEYIIQKTNSKSKINYIPREQVFGNYNEIMIRFANISKAKQLLDYKINFNTEQVIDEIIREFKI